MISATQPSELVTCRMSRRELLAAAVGGIWLSSPFAALGASVSGNRSLSFVHTHTGEKLSVNYWCDGQFQTQCLTPLNHFMRDFRTGEMATMDAGLLDILYELQVLANREATYEIISAYRSPETNAKLSAKSAGVAKKSLHMDGCALDIRITGFSTKKLQTLALANQRGGVGFYAKSDFVHLDTGRVRTWVG